MTLTPFKNESLLNFAMSDTREKMKLALTQVKTELGKSYRLKDGAEGDVVSGNIIESHNPARISEIVGRVEIASVDQAEKALSEMHAGIPAWRATSAEHRIQLLVALADWMRKRRYELSAWMVFEVGKTWKEADGDVCEAIDFCEYYAREMNRLAEPQVTQVVSGEHDFLVYNPRGLALVIAPWNFPLAILTGMTVAALVTGNTVIIKPAEQSSVIAAKLAQGLKEVGFPTSSFYFLPGVGEEIGPKLVEDARVDMIVFTGSADVGFSIIESAAKRPKAGQKGVKKVVAEMGGKNAVIVDEDADLDEAILGCIHSAFGFQGQKCSALSRLIVHKNVYDNFVKRFAEAASALKIGNPVDPEYQVGPVIDRDAQSRIEKTISSAKARLKILFEAKSIPAGGYFIKPIVFEVTDRNDDLFQKEIFGPVVAVKKAENLDEAILDLNSVPYALTGGIFSRSPSHIDRAKRELEVGNLYINRAITGAIVQRHPFGGYKFSGIGSKAGGPDYLLQFVEPRAIAENTVRRGFAASPIQAKSA